MRQAVLDALRLLELEGPTHRALGICDHLWKNLRRHYGQELTEIESQKIREIYRELFRSWDEFSGNIVYPVPHPLKDPSEAFGDDNLWDESVYGRYRWALLRHMIEELEAACSPQSTE